MGYYMNQEDSVFFIAKKDFINTLDAIKLLMTKVKELGSSVSSTGEIWFAFVITKLVSEAQSLSEALEGWRYHTETDKDGNIHSIYFTGEKLGQDQLLFDAIAPFVKEGSYISMIGESGCKWKWIFKNNQCVKVFNELIEEKIEKEVKKEQMINMNELLYLHLILNKNVEKFHEIGMPNASEQNYNCLKIIENMINNYNK